MNKALCRKQDKNYGWQQTLSIESVVRNNDTAFNYMIAYFSTGFTTAEASRHVVEEAEGFMRERTAL